MNLMRYISTLFLCLFTATVCVAQTEGERLRRIEKRYHLFFEVNSSSIDGCYKDNSRTIEDMRRDIEATLLYDNAVPDSILILSTSSPDGRYEYNRILAKRRALSTSKLLHEFFPQFSDSHIRVEFLEEDWDGLRQVLRANPDFPQRDEMLIIVESSLSPDMKEKALRACKEGWDRLISDYVYALRNSSITITVIGKRDEYAISEALDSLSDISYIPVFEQPSTTIQFDRRFKEKKWRKMILAARTNLLFPGLSVGLEFPIKDNWSIGFDYMYPWAVSKNNRWCAEMLGLFLDARYWFPGEKNKWSRTERLQGHAVGVYAGAGYYDFQNKKRGAQGEYLDFGVDYTYALPVANNKLRFEFNIGIGMIRTQYRPYYPASDYSDLIKEPGIKYHTTNFFGPTRAGVSLVVPIVVNTKAPKELRGGKER